MLLFKHKGSPYAKVIRGVSFRYFAAVLMLLFHFQIGSAAKLHLIGLDQRHIDGKHMNVQPGDTIGIIAGKREILHFTNINGDADRYVIVRNYGGVVEIANDTLNYGVNFNYSSFFRFTGTGDPDHRYGIRILKTRLGANGLSVDRMSTDYELDHLEIANTGFAGMMLQTHPTCDLLSNRDVFVQRNTQVHSNYIHHTSGEGMYIGHAYYTGYTRECDGTMVVLYPHEIIGLRVYNNILDSCGYDGIQIGGAAADCEVYDNRVYAYGARKTDAQSTGIQVGAGSTGRFYNNLIANGSGTGIKVFGKESVYVYNNIIINAGFGFSETYEYSNHYGIFSDDRSTTASTTFYFINNTIINTKSDGIRLSSRQGKPSKVFNNVIVQPGSIGRHRDATQSFIYLSSFVMADVSNNYFLSRLPADIYLQSVEDVYDFTAGLPITGGGKDVSAYGVTHDYLYRLRPSKGEVRPQSTNSDVGAFQFNDDWEDYLTVNRKISFYDDLFTRSARRQFTISPNPGSGHFTVSTTHPQDSMNEVMIRDLDGRMVHAITPLKPQVELQLTSMLVSGTYLVTVVTQRAQQTQLLIVR